MDWFIRYLSSVLSLKTEKTFRPVFIVQTDYYFPLLCKMFEIMVTDEIVTNFNTPDNQVGFKKGVSLDHSLHINSNLLMHAEVS